MSHVSYELVCTSIKKSLISILYSNLSFIYLQLLLVFFYIFSFCVFLTRTHKVHPAPGSTTHTRLPKPVCFFNRDPKREAGALYSYYFLRREF